MYVPFPGSDSVRADSDGNIPAGTVYSFSVHGIWDINNRSYGAGTENHGKQTFDHRNGWGGNGKLEFLPERLGCEREIRELVGWDHGNDI